MGFLGSLLGNGEARGSISIQNGPANRKLRVRFVINGKTMLLDRPDDVGDRMMR